MAVGGASPGFTNPKPAGFERAMRRRYHRSCDNPPLILNEESSDVRDDDVR